MRPRHRNSCARGEPMIVILESYPELLVVHPQIAVSAARHDVRRDLHDLLRHDADVGLAAAVIAKAIEAKTIVQIAEKNDVMLEPDVGAPTPAAAPAAATAAAGAHAATAAAAACAQATAAAAAAEASMTSATAAMARSGAAMRRSRLGACALTATMCAFGTLTGTMAFAHIRAAAARPVAGLGAGPITAGTDSIAGFVAGLGHLLTATANIALTSGMAGLPMIDPRWPPITAAGDRMRGPIPRRRDVDVVAAAAPVDVAAPIAS